MLRFFRRGLDRKGQGTTEYIIIVVIIAVLSIAVIKIFGERIRGLFGYAAEEMVGKEGQDPSAAGGDANEAAETDFGTEW